MYDFTINDNDSLNDNKQEWTTKFVLWLGDKIEVM